MISMPCRHHYEAIVSVLVSVRHLVEGRPLLGRILTLARTHISSLHTNNNNNNNNNRQRDVLFRIMWTKQLRVKLRLRGIQRSTRETSTFFIRH